MHIIQINDLSVRAIIGTHPWERTNKQDLIININLEYDATKASKSDSIKDALNYESVAGRIIKTVEKSRYLLLEKLAARLLEGILADKRVERACVRLDKPHAIPQAKSVSFEVCAEQAS